MDHYYRLSDIDNYKIAKINNKTILNIQDTEKVIVQKINSVEEIPSDFPFDKNALPKNNEYIEHRYFKHPVYKYDLFLFGNDLIVATRIQKYNDSACLRIVDIMGNYSKIPYITGFFDKYMKENMLEYADCYCTKLSSEIWNKAGFIELKTEENIIPEHFAPYECKNIDICYSSSPKEIILFKGDGDMDRPS